MEEVDQAQDINTRYFIEYIVPFLNVLKETEPALCLKNLSGQEIDVNALLAVKDCSALKKMIGAQDDDCPDFQYYELWMQANDSAPLCIVIADGNIECQIRTFRVFVQESVRAGTFEHLGGSFDHVINILKHAFELSKCVDPNEPVQGYEKEIGTFLENARTANASLLDASHFSYNF